MNNIKIDWCDCTVDPVVGCSYGCSYCYARRLNSRSHFVEDFTKPEYFPARLTEFDDQTPKTIFIDSMSDISAWSGRQMLDVAAAMKNNPQHHYIALTKQFSLFWNKKIALEQRGYDMAGFKALYLGLTLATQGDIDRLGFVYDNDFVCLEPYLTPLNIDKVLKQSKMLPTPSRLRQVIIGAEIGGRRNKVIPDRGAVCETVAQCDEYGLRVFMNESLRDIMLNDFRQDKLIWAF